MKNIEERDDFIFVLWKESTFSMLEMAKMEFRDFLSAKRIRAVLLKRKRGESINECERRIINAFDAAKGDCGERINCLMTDGIPVRLSISSIRKIISFKLKNKKL